MITQAHQVKLLYFEGPLDLLLYLIRQHEIDIHDIPISEIILQYMSALDTMYELNLEVAGEFILMVSYLLHIKAQMLLPQSDEFEEEEEDPRQQLVDKLLEYQKFKIIGEEFKRCEIERTQYYPYCVVPSSISSFENLNSDISPYNLLQAYMESLADSSEALPRIVTPPMIDIMERIEFVRRKLEQYGKMTFLELSEGLSRIYLVSTFIALLELIRLKELKVKQARLFGNIIIATADYVKS